MTAKILVGYWASLFRMGSPNAAVFPEPVYELMITLFPWMTEGMARVWMGVGVWYLIFWQVLRSQSESFSLLKDI